MIIVATDAPLSGIQLERLAKCSVFGLARTGSVMADSSGDSAIAFSTQAASHESIPHNDLTTFSRPRLRLPMRACTTPCLPQKPLPAATATPYTLSPLKSRRIIRRHRNEAV
jgi:Peptidase family S58